MLKKVKAAANIHHSTCCNGGSMVRDSYEGIRTCNLWVTVLIRGYKKGIRWGTSEFPDQLIALLNVSDTRRDSIDLLDHFYKTVICK